MSRTRMTTLLIFIFYLCPLTQFFTSFSFLEYNSVTIRNILMILGVAYNSAYLFLKLCPLIRIFTSLSFPEHNSVTIRNIVTILGSFIEQVNTECRVQE